MEQQVPLRELNQHTSAVIHRVADDGEELTVTRAGEAVARITPITSDESLLSRLVAEGRAEAPSRSGPLPRPVRTKEPVDVAQALSEDRENERW